MVHHPVRTRSEVSGFIPVLLSFERCQVEQAVRGTDAPRTQARRFDPTASPSGNQNFVSFCPQVTPHFVLCSGLLIEHWAPAALRGGQVFIQVW
jgi:hypothetical protein